MGRALTTMLPASTARQLSGTLRVQLDHLRVALATVAARLPSPAKSPAMKARGGLSDEAVRRVLKRRGAGKTYAESAATLAVALGVTRHRIETVRARCRA